MSNVVVESAIKAVKAEGLRLPRVQKRSADSRSSLLLIFGYFQFPKFFAEVTLFLNKLWYYFQEVHVFENITIL